MRPGPVPSSAGGIRDTNPTNRLNEGVSLDDLLLAVAVDDGVETLERPPAHQVTHAFFLDAEPLDLVVDVEEERVVARRVVARPHQKTAWPACNLSH